MVGTVQRCLWKLESSLGQVALEHDKDVDVEGPWAALANLGVHLFGQYTKDNIWKAPSS